MAITAQFLSQCTDEEINKGVSWALTHNKCKKLGYASASDSEFYYHWGRAMISAPSSYCANPNDIMPIAFSNEISLVLDGEPMAAIDVAFDGPFCSVGLSSFNTNPLRAICEVYILMSVSK